MNHKRQWHKTGNNSTFTYISVDFCIFEIREIKPQISVAFKQKVTTTHRHVCMNIFHPSEFSFNGPSSNILLKFDHFKRTPLAAGASYAALSPTERAALAAITARFDVTRVYGDGAGGSERTAPKIVWLDQEGLKLPCPDQGEPD